MEEKNLTKIIEKFKSQEIPRFEKLERYFRVKHDILQRNAKDGKPNNKLAHGFAKYITKMATGYFMGKGVRYHIEDVSQAGEGSEDSGGPGLARSASERQEYKDILFDILDNNYTDNSNFEIAKEASKKGVAFEILYIDEKSRLKTKKLNAEEVIPIYSQSVGEFLEAAVRIWNETDFDGRITELAALYTEKEILTYSKGSTDALYRLIDIRAHMLEDIPLIVYWNNEERTGDYEDIITLIDAYDKAQSDTANDSEYFADAYMWITGASGGITTGAGADEDADGSEEAYRTLRRERILELDEKGQAGWLIKNVNDAAQENYKNRLYKNIFFISQVPALSDESFAGNLTGVAIRYKLIGLEELTTEKEHKFLSAQKKKIRIITDFINTKHNKNFNADDVELKTERNFIDNLTEMIENADKLDGLTSKETLLGLLPFIKDVGAELVKIRREETQDILKDDVYEDFDRSFTSKTNKGAMNNGLDSQKST